MSRIFTGAVLIAGLLGAVQAGAQGIRLSGSAQQSFQLDSNSNLSGAGLDFSSVSSLNLNLTSQTPTTRIGASTGVSLSFGSNQTVSINRPRLNLSFGTSRKDYTISGRLGFSNRPAQVDVLQPDLSILRYTGDETRISGGLGLAGPLDASTRGSLDFSADVVDYDPVSAGLFPNNNFRLSGSVSRAVTPTTSFGVAVGFGLFEADNASETTSFSADVSGTVSHQLDSSTAVNGNLGVSFIETTDTVLGVENETYSVTMLFGADLTHQLPDGAIGLSLAQNVAPSGGGSLVIDTSLSGTYTRAVNRNVNIGLGVSVGRQENIASGTSSTFLSISPTYSRQLTRDVSANASVYLQRDGGGATATGVTVSLGRNFDFPL